MEGVLVGGGRRKAPKVIPVPVPGKAEEEEKRGPGRPPGSGSKKKDDDDSLALLLKAGIDMLATMRAQAKGPHWLTVTSQSEEIAKLTSKVIDKWFPVSKATKYADEVRLLFLAGQAVGPLVMIDMMNAKTAEQQPADHEKGGNAGGGSSGPSNVRSISREGEGPKPHAGNDVKRSGPSVVPG